MLLFPYLSKKIYNEVKWRADIYKIWWKRKMYERDSNSRRWSETPMRYTHATMSLLDMSEIFTLMKCMSINVTVSLWILQSAISNVF